MRKKKVADISRSRDLLGVVVNYSFDVEVATKYGVDEAIVIQNFQFWIFKNKAGERHSHDGRTWTFNSIKALETIFPFWSVKQIRRVIKSLVDKGILMTGNYNQKGYDQTTWYAFIDEEKWLEPLFLLNCPKGQMELPKKANAIAQTDKPIPDIKPDNKQQILEIYTFDDFYEAYPKKAAKSDAERAWKKISPVLHETIMSDVKNRTENHAGWIDKKYIPNPSTYLNGKRWQDEIEQKSLAPATNRTRGSKQPMQFPDYSGLWEEQGNFIDSTAKVIN
jgi:hypothetical protein